MVLGHRRHSAAGTWYPHQHIEETNWLTMIWHAGSRASQDVDPKGDGLTDDETVVDAEQGNGKAHDLHKQQET